MPPAVKRERDPWPQEREGYSEPPPVAYVTARVNVGMDRDSAIIHRVEQIGSVVAGGGIVWTTYAVAHHSAEIARFALFPPGPLEVLGIGVLIWLVAKWVRASQVR
ncbi:MAG: hypothetical protein ACLP2H_03890 [Terriglobales bacterium]